MVYTFGPPTLLHLVVSALVLSDSQRAEECSNEAVKPFSTPSRRIMSYE
jgi:hypothetical protein